MKHDRTVTVDRELAAPADAVYAMIADVTRMGEWSPENQGGHWLGAATGPAVGARFKGRNRSGWRRWSTLNTITSAEPGRRFAFRTTFYRIPISTWEYRLAPTETGCRVTESWTDLRPAALAAAIGDPVIMGIRDRAAHNRAGMVATLEQLAATAEHS